ncbi:hypothetical protein HDU96_010034 [Phlyctochytrium bullatum]|nr:hypothetical protein HDU96_010034 [Phlyctochytrium bullatum]
MTTAPVGSTLFRRQLGVTVPNPKDTTPTGANDPTKIAIVLGSVIGFLAIAVTLLLVRYLIVRRRMKKEEIRHTKGKFPAQDDEDENVVYMVSSRLEDYPSPLETSQVIAAAYAASVKEYYEEAANDDTQSRHSRPRSSLFESSPAPAPGGSPATTGPELSPTEKLLSAIGLLPRSDSRLERQNSLARIVPPRPDDPALELYYASDYGNESPSSRASSLVRGPSSPVVPSRQPLHAGGAHTPRKGRSQTPRPRRTGSSSRSSSSSLRNAYYAPYNGGSAGGGDLYFANADNPYYQQPSSPASLARPKRHTSSGSMSRLYSAGAGANNRLSVSSSSFARGAAPPASGGRRQRAPSGSSRVSSSFSARSSSSRPASTRSGHEADRRGRRARSASSAGRRSSRTLNGSTTDGGGSRSSSPGPEPSKFRQLVYMLTHGRAMPKPSQARRKRREQPPLNALPPRNAGGSSRWAPPAPRGARFPVTIPHVPPLPVEVLERRRELRMERERREWEAYHGILSEEDEEEGAEPVVVITVDGEGEVERGRGKGKAVAASASASASATRKFSHVEPLGGVPSSSSASSARTPSVPPPSSSAQLLLEGEDELPLRVGDAVVVYEWREDGWCFGRREDGSPGTADLEEEERGPADGWFPIVCVLPKSKKVRAKLEGVSAERARLWVASGGGTGGNGAVGVSA